ncbi:PP2C family protein-serine/threonine phosphatase [Streptomyces sp. NPDC046977]|uniref:PP2C family protein-serine/threonine phosphatase n=1 Tax=Streptomyces sp. NPDC046977 TaxID=3154703 RepID=UPI0033D12499
MANVGGIIPDRPGEVARSVRWLPAVLLVCGFLVDYFAPVQFSGAAFYSVAPMIAAALLSADGTILTGLCAIVADAVTLGHFGLLATGSGMSELMSITAVALGSVVINRLLLVRDARLRSAQSITATVQRAVLPAPPARVGALRIAARYEAAEQEADIGGDLYAVQTTPYGLRCIIGDVCGKGMDSVEAAIAVVGTFRMAADEEPTLAGVVARLDRALHLGAQRADRPWGRGEWFATALIAEFPPGTQEMRLINRGHAAPFLLHKAAVRAIEPTRRAVPLGLGLGDEPDLPDTVAMLPGCTVLLCTDGIHEARNRHGAFYDPQARLATVRFSTPNELLRKLIDDIDRHTAAPRSDDTALLAFTYDP